jgi:hypothetical protein
MGLCVENKLSLCIITELLETNLQNILHSADIKLSTLQVRYFICPVFVFVVVVVGVVVVVVVVVVAAAAAAAGAVL